MESDDANTVILQIRKDGIRYNHPVDDLLFAAHSAVNLTDISKGDSIVSYLSDWPVSMIACRHQVCSLP
jgi:hypothetical protein